MEETLTVVPKHCQVDIVTNVTVYVNKINEHLSIVSPLNTLKIDQKSCYISDFYRGEKGKEHIKSMHGKFTKEFALRDAAIYNDLQKVDLLISQGVDVNHRFYDAGTVSVLTSAVKNNNICVVSRLLDAGAAVNSSIYKHYPPLLTAVILNFTAIALKLIDEGACVNVCDPDWRNPVIVHAIENGNAEIVAKLVSVGADMQLTNNIHRCPLFHAARCANISMVSAIVNAGARINKCAYEHEHPLASVFSISRDLSEKNVIVGKYLIQQGADVNEYRFLEALHYHIVAEDIEFSDYVCEMLRFTMRAGLRLNSSPSLSLLQYKDYTHRYTMEQVNGVWICVSMLSLQQQNQRQINMLERIHNYRTNPQSLQDNATVRIRQLLGADCKGIHAKVMLLPLPKLLMKYLLLTE